MWNRYSQVQITNTTESLPKPANIDSYNTYGKAEQFPNFTPIMAMGNNIQFGMTPTQYNVPHIPIYQNSASINTYPPPQVYSKDSEYMTSCNNSQDIPSHTIINENINLKKATDRVESLKPIGIPFLSPYVEN